MKKSQKVSELLRLWYVQPHEFWSSNVDDCFSGGEDVGKVCLARELLKDLDELDK